jgi:hypothetical protein
MTTQERINRLYYLIASNKAELNAEDYKVTRAFEQGLELSATFKETRQRLRDEINAAEMELLTLNAQLELELTNQTEIGE